MRFAVVFVATVMYVAAWFLPSLEDPGSLGGSYSGWQAFMFGPALLWMATDLLARNGVWPEALWVVLYSLSTLSNGLFVVVVIPLLTRSSWSPSRGLRATMVALAVLNTHPLILLPGGLAADDLRIGYYMWTGSFILIALAAETLRTDSSGSR